MLSPELIAAARKLIQADTVTDRGNLRAVEVLEPLCTEAGLSPRRLPAPDSADRDANLLAGPGGGQDARGDPLLLVAHLDTVDPGPRDRWKTDPFTLTIEGDRAFGLGVADVKLDALCKLWAARRLRDVRLKRPFYFLGTYGEEAGLRGARAFLEAPPLHPFAALCGEPSELTLCHAHKGYAVVRVRIASRTEIQYAASPAVSVSWQGRAAHSSTPHLGVNAIDLALDALSRSGVPYAMFIEGGAGANTIPASCRAVVYLRPGCGPALWAADASPLAPETWANVTTLLPTILQARDLWKSLVRELQPERDERFDPAEAVASVTRIRTEHNAVELTMDARLLPDHDIEALLRTFRERVAGDVAVDRNASGMALPEDHPLLLSCGAALESIGLSAKPRAKPTSTEAGVFARAGIPALVFGPSRSTGNAHTANEVADLTQVARAIEAYEAIIRRLCG